MNIGPYICESEADCKKKFGDELFGEFLSGRYGWAVEAERDTEFEKKAFQAVKDWVTGDSGGREAVKNQEKILKIFKDLQKCTKHYPEILEPNMTKLYRGVILPEKIARPMGIESFDTGTVTAKYTPYNLMESWTVSKSNIEWWLRSRMHKMESEDKALLKKRFNVKGKAMFVGVIVEAKFPKNELLFSSIFLDEISDYIWNSIEEEIVRVSNKPIQAKITPIGHYKEI